MKKVLLLRFPLGAGLLCAGSLMLWAAASNQIQGAIALGEIFVVNSTGYQDDAFPGDGNCETQIGNGVCTLRAALEEVMARKNGGDGISFSIPTTDPGYGNGAWYIQLFQALPDITVPLRISGPGANVLFIDGGGDVRFTNRVLNVTTAGTVSISGLTITGGTTTSGQYGAGIQNVNGGTINLTNCTFTNNKSHVGSGQYQGGAGGIYNAGNGTINISGCTFESNSGDTYALVTYGGAIWNKTGTLHVTNSTFHHNQSEYYGGAIWNDSGTVTVTGSTFYRNGAALGGAVASGGGTVSITNSTFYQNIAYAFGDGNDTGLGGAICNFRKGVLNLTNSTVTANFSNYGGGGVFNDKTFGTSIANVKSTIIAGNFGGMGDNGSTPDVYGPFNSSGFNLIGKKDGSTGFTAATDKKGTVASPLNPKLDVRGLRDNGGPTQTVALLTGSPAIDKGTSVGLTGTLTTDQRGFARKVDNSSILNASGGDGTDIGAYEFGAQ